MRIRIKKGNHYPTFFGRVFGTPQVACGFTGNITGTVRFTNSCATYEEYLPECVGDTNKVVGRTSGFSRATSRSVRLGWRRSFLKDLHLGEIQLIILYHAGSMRFKYSPPRFIISKFIRVDEALHYTFECFKGYTIISLETANWTQVIDVPVDIRKGLPLGPYMGGQCAASKEVVLNFN